MVYYVYRVEWNNNPETETFEKFDDAKALVDQKLLLAILNMFHLSFMK